VGASAIVNSSEPVMTMIIINDPGAAAHAQEMSEPVASRGFEPSDLPIQIVSPDGLPAVALAPLDAQTDDQSPTAEATGDQSGRALMFGRYMGQITARIERAWLRSRDPLDDPLFRCRVQIRQSKSGDVREVTLQSCNGTPAWQASLVEAIQTASPLPAPPDPSVFADALTLSFEAGPYHEGGSGDGFEPAPIQLATTGSYSLGPDTAEIMRRRPPPGVIELRIIGKHDDSLDVPQSPSEDAQTPPVPGLMREPEPTAPDAN
jgi:hypothetical protein